MKSAIHKQDLSGEFFAVEQCFITELVNSADDPDVSIARARVTPGVTTHWHQLRDTTERYVILAGEGRVEVGGCAQRVTVGDVVIIPPLVRQRITNIGNDDLIFLAICSPRFVEANYEELAK